MGCQILRVHPGKPNRGMTIGTRTATRGDADPVVAIELCGTSIAFYQNQRLREYVMLEKVAWKAHRTGDRSPASHTHHYRGGILAFDALLYLVCVAIDVVGFPEQEPANIEKVHAHIGEDEVLQLL